MSDALAVAALLIAAGALVLAWRALGAAQAGAAAALERIEAIRGSLPAARPLPSAPSASTDPSVLVRLDALESRQASLDLRASIASAGAPAAPPVGARPDDASAPAVPARRAHSMFP